MNANLNFVRGLFRPLLAAAALLLLAAGCQTTGPSTGPIVENTAPDPSIALREGDVIKVTFPDAPKLTSSQTVRRDGKISLPVLGEVDAVGKTPAEVEKEILDKYGNQLVTKEVTVALDSSIFPVFVNGAVIRPGKILSNRPLTALEAIMEAGGFDYTKANLKTVRVVRTEGNQVKNFTLDFRGVLEGEATEPFYLKPSDIIYVSERFNLF